MLLCRCYLQGLDDVGDAGYLQRAGRKLKRNQKGSDDFTRQCFWQMPKSPRDRDRKAKQPYLLAYLAILAC